jgi:hypothetical protein
MVQEKGIGFAAVHKAVRVKIELLRLQSNKVKGFRPV